MSNNHYILERDRKFPGNS